MILVGIANPKSPYGRGYEKFQLRQEELAFTSKEIRRRKVVQDPFPVCIEHDTSYRVGNVEDSWIDENGNLVVALHICNVAAPLVLKAIRDRLYRGLSIGGPYAESKDQTRMTAFRPGEISLCLEPDVPGSVLQFVYYRESDVAVEKKEGT